MGKIKMTIKDFRKLDNGGKVKGFMTIVTNEGFEMKNFKLIEGANGLFVGAPSQKGPDKDGNEKWLEINKKYSEIWPNIVIKKNPPEDSDTFKDEENKFEKYFKENL